MNRTDIEYLKPGYTWNPTTGCTQIRAGCDHCWAKQMAARQRGRNGYPADDPFRPTFHPDRLDEPLKLRKPARIGVCLMGDLFHEAISFSIRREIFDVMQQCQNHTFIVLTKRPAKMRGFASWYASAINAPTLRPNIWCGVSVSTQEDADELIPLLLDTPAAKRFVSFEPALEFVNFRLWLRQLDWIVAGAETGPHKRRVDDDVFRNVRDQCFTDYDLATPFFLKQLSDGRRELDGRRWEEVPR